MGSLSFALVVKYFLMPLIVRELKSEHQCLASRILPSRPLKLSYQKHKNDSNGLKSLSKNIPELLNKKHMYCGETTKIYEVRTVSECINAHARIHKCI